MQKTPSASISRIPKKSRRRALSAMSPSGGWMLFVLSAATLFLLLRHSDAAIHYMGQGLVLCAKTVIPSLFPFMVLSEWLVAGGSGALLGKLFEKPFRRLFGISGTAAGALLMGLICGFPIGTKTAAALCRQGELDADELSRLVCFCNIPSSAFLINAVGVTLFASRRFGVLLYLIALLTSLLTGILLHLLSPLPARTAKRSPTSTAPHGISLFTASVTSSATAMLYVCAYVVFFSALVGALGQMLCGLAPSETLTAALFGFFELSSGVLQASRIPDKETALWLGALLCGWSGCSVHMQILSLCTNLPNGTAVRPIPYLICKLFQGILYALLCGLALFFLPPTWFAPTSSIHTLAPSEEFFPQISIFCNVLLGLSCLWLFFGHFRRSKRR